MLREATTILSTKIREMSKRQTTSVGYGSEEQEKMYGGVGVAR